MNHTDHVHLIRQGIATTGGVWADLGSGAGAFTLALADLLGQSGQIYSIDQDQTALREQKQNMTARFPHMQVHYQVADFTQPLTLPPLDGVIMANSLHFHRHKERLVKLVKSYLRAEGRLILVEYNVSWGNPWVPYPIGYAQWVTLAQQCGFTDTHLLATVPSRFLKEIYAAVSQ
jgi:ubiquinone/menaquinone biosynthesis C-methylase UbiE